MFKLRLPRTALVALALLALPATVRAEDFNITIPIEFTRLPPEITGFDIGCLVRTRPAEDPTGRVIGEGSSARIPISRGAYRDDVIVRFNAFRTADPTAARYYGCTLTMFAGAVTSYGADDIRRGRAFPLAAGSPARTSTLGPIPR